MKNIWKEILEIVYKSNNNIDVIDGNKELGMEECINLNIPKDSVLYSVVTNSNGIIINNWIRLWGQNSNVNNGVGYYNTLFQNDIEGLFLVASDVLGGLFAININKFTEGKNHIWYFAPDTLEWECMDMQYNEFLAWSMQGDIDEFYLTMRWNNWQEDIKNIGINYALLIYPFLWARECVVLCQDLVQIKMRSSAS
ncbi:DUF2625 family protein [Lachnobacterium bovis]|uniref:DUF2625 family protein n=1 Tax=Lachnobacterium bovis TaxID=140626 RepID=UPI00068A0012|nr:DUF2625 family protein [Lachnobacterium bovis]